MGFRVQVLGAWLGLGDGGDWGLWDVWGRGSELRPKAWKCSPYTRGPPILIPTYDYKDTESRGGTSMTFPTY